MPATASTPCPVHHTYDRVADAAYVYLTNAPVVRQERHRDVVLDIDADGQVVGVEILGVTRRGAGGGAVVASTGGGGGAGGVTTPPASGEGGHGGGVTVTRPGPRSPRGRR